jgi:hypothetical protein
MKKRADWRRRIGVVALGWAGATVFFSAILAISGPWDGHKPLDFALYSNAALYGRVG